jgi:hypothetical protein
MSEIDAPVLRQMAPGEMLHAPDSRDAWLSVIRGRVWVTQAGDPVDHFLEGGQSIRLAAGARALIGAEGPAEVVVAPAPESRDGWHARLGRVFAAWRDDIRTTGPVLPRFSPGTGDALEREFVG